MQVRKQQLELDMEQQTGSKSGKEYIKAVLSPCLFNLYAEYIMKNAGLDEAQAGIKIAGRIINNLRYENDSTLTTESEELKSLLMKVKQKEDLGERHQVVSENKRNFSAILLSGRNGKAASYSRKTGSRAV